MWLGRRERERENKQGDSIGTTVICEIMIVVRPLRILFHHDGPFSNKPGLHLVVLAPVLIDLAYICTTAGRHTGEASRQLQNNKNDITNRCCHPASFSSSSSPSLRLSVYPYPSPSPPLVACVFASPRQSAPPSRQVQRTPLRAPPGAWRWLLFAVPQHVIRRSNVDTSQRKHAFSFRSCSSRRFFSVGLRKYSPDSSCRSICTRGGGE